MIRVHDTGIGIAITDQLVQLMGGEIVVESERWGSGFHRVFNCLWQKEGNVEENDNRGNRGTEIRITRSAVLGILLGGGLFRRYWMASGGCDTGSYYYDAVKGRWWRHRIWCTRHWQKIIILWMRNRSLIPEMIWIPSWQRSRELLRICFYGRKLC